MKRLNYLSTLLKLKSNNIYPSSKNNNIEAGINIDSHIHKQIKLNTINTLANLVSSKDKNNNDNDNNIIHLGIDLNNNNSNDNSKTYIQNIKYNIKSKKIEAIDNIEI